MLALLRALVLAEVGVAQAPAGVSDVPTPLLVLADHGLRGVGDRLLVDGVGDQFADRERDRPVFEDLPDVQVERLNAGGGARGSHAARMPSARDISQRRQLPVRQPRWMGP